MNIVVINLTRFGDQLQSQAAINALAGQSYANGSSENRICLITLANFASSTAFLNNVDLSYPLPKDAFMEALKNDWPLASSQIWEWRQELYKRFKPDAVCNLTPSVSARLLGRFLAQKLPLSGYGLDEFGFGTASAWAAFFQGSSRRREVSPFNIVDLFRAVAGKSRGQKDDFKLLAPSSDSHAAQRIDTLLDKALRNASPQETLDHANCSDRASSESNPKAPEATTPNTYHAKDGTAPQAASKLTHTAKGFVAFQLGASEARRRWPVEYFAALGRDIWQKSKHIPLLLGGTSEEELALRYAAAASKLDPSTPHISLIGRTNLPELACALMRSSLLVSNDTGTMHLAAGLGRPILGIFLATAQPWDTGPYLVGSCSLEPGLNCHPCSFGQSCPHNEKCRYAISVEEVSALCLSFLQTGEWSPLNSVVNLDAQADELSSPTVAATGEPQSDMQLHTGAVNSLIVNSSSNLNPDRARIWLAEKDEAEFLTLRSLSAHDSDARTVWFCQQRHFLRQFLDRDPAQPFVYLPSAKKFTLPQPEAEKLATELNNLSALLNLLAELGNMLLQQPLPVLQERFISALNKVSSAFSNSSYLLSLGLLWQVEVQEKGDKLADALKCIKDYYSLISSIFQELKE